MGRAEWFVLEILSATLTRHDASRVHIDATPLWTELETMLATTKVQVSRSIAWSAHKMEFDGDVMKSAPEIMPSVTSMPWRVLVAKRRSFSAHSITPQTEELMTEREGFILPEARLFAIGFTSCLLADVDHACQVVAQRYMSLRGFRPLLLAHDGGALATVPLVPFSRSRSTVRQIEE